MMVLRWIVTALVTMAVLLDCQGLNAREVFYQSGATRQADHVALSRQTHAALEKAGKPVRLVVYPAFGRDGHVLFFQVRQPYWADVVKFLKDKL
jgi:LmbE family N-acetylglucosaminyl deacetylase